MAAAAAAVPEVEDSFRRSVTRSFRRSDTGSFLQRSVRSSRRTTEPLLT